MYIKKNVYKLIVAEVTATDPRENVSLITSEQLQYFMDQLLTRAELKGIKHGCF